MISVSKNEYINKSDDNNNYNNLYHSTIKIKPVDVKPSTYIDFGKEIIIKTLNLKLVTMQEYQNIKKFLQNVTFHIGVKKILGLEKVVNAVPWMYVIEDLN